MVSTRYAAENRQYLRLPVQVNSMRLIRIRGSRNVNARFRHGSWSRLLRGMCLPTASFGRLILARKQQSLTARIAAAPPRGVFRRKDR